MEGGGGDKEIKQKGKRDKFEPLGAKRRIMKVMPEERISQSFYF